MAFTFGFTRSICFMCAARASRAGCFFARIDLAISTALIKQTDVQKVGGRGLHLQSAIEERHSGHAEQDFAAVVVTHGREFITRRNPK